MQFVLSPARKVGAFQEDFTILFFLYSGSFLPLTVTAAFPPLLLHRLCFPWHISRADAKKMLWPEALGAANKLAVFLTVSLLPVTGRQQYRSWPDFYSADNQLCSYVWSSVHEYIYTQLTSILNFEERYHPVSKEKLTEMAVLLTRNRKKNKYSSCQSSNWQVWPNPKILVALKFASQMGLLWISEFIKKKIAPAAVTLTFTHLPLPEAYLHFFLLSPTNKGIFNFGVTQQLYIPMWVLKLCALNSPLAAHLNITKNDKNNSLFMTGEGINKGLQKPKLNNKTWKLTLFLLLKHQIATFKRTRVKNGRLFIAWAKLLLG